MTNLYATLAPFVFAMILFEFFYCLVKKNGYYSFQDSLMGMGTMIIAQCFNLLIAVIVVKSYGFIYERYAITQLPPTLLNYVLCYLGGDFLFYWFHRACHRVNFLWAAHVTHHSAEELNYAVALRTSFTQRAGAFLFYWPLAILGFSPEMVLSMVALNLLYQFVPHTRVISKLPSWIDSWLNTPYHHQVHHAANPLYWDKNYGGTLIIWDRLFGSYKDQTEEPYYGVAIHPKSWDPTFLTLHWYTCIFKDMMQATSFVDKIKIWFMPPDFRPRNLPPHEKPKGVNAKTQIKFKTKAFDHSTSYLLIQLLIALGVVLSIMTDRFEFTGEQKIILSLMLWLMITGWGLILQSKRIVFILEPLRIISMFFVYSRFLPLYTPYYLMIGGISLVWFLFIMNKNSDRTLLRTTSS